MPRITVNSLADFDRFLTSTITPWSKRKRSVLAAAMAERWLPVYEVFSEKYDWGKPSVLRDAVHFVWNCVLRNKVNLKELTLHRERLEKNTPHMDNFDCADALSTCSFVSDALSCCVSPENTFYPVSAMRVSFEAFVPNIAIYPEEVPPSAWWKRGVQKEFEKQLKVLRVIGRMTRFDEKRIKALRQKLLLPDLRGPRSPNVKRPRRLTNEAIFERYRHVIEPFAEDHWPSALHSLEYEPVMVRAVFIQWAARYRERKHSLKRMRDARAHDAQLARNSTHDAAVQGDPGWDEDTHFSIVANYQEPDFELDINNPESPHSYGPSFRRLCLEGKLEGVLQWVHHRPPAWLEENRRKKQGLAYAVPELFKRLTRKLSWRLTDDVDHPWATRVAGKTWRVRLNDFPDDIMYTLIINDAVVGKFHDWPKAWQR
jgi:uncharacterized protein YjaG (DUF416 family)